MIAASYGGGELPARRGEGRWQKDTSLWRRPQAFRPLIGFRVILARGDLRAGCFSTALLREIQKSQQPTFGRQPTHARQKGLESFEVGGSFHRDQLVFPLRARLLPALRNLGRIRRGIRYAGVLEARLVNEPFVLSRRTVHVVANRTTHGYFFI